jgi:sporulation protein YqfC
LQKFKNNGLFPNSIDMGGSAIIEMCGNRSVTMEGSTGILLYESNNIKINTRRMVVSFEGRGLSVKCISETGVEICGFITKIEFLA